MDETPSNVPGGNAGGGAGSGAGGSGGPGAGGPAGGGGFAGSAPPPPPPPPPGGAGGPGGTYPGAGYPVTLEVTASPEIARWRPFVQWLLAIPHWIVLYVLHAVLGILWIIAFFTILFTRSIPSGMYDFMVMIFRYNWRVASYALFLREDYPPFDFTAVSADPGGDPAVFAMPPPGELRRLMPLVKWLLIIPQLFVLWLVWIAASVVILVSAFAVLFTRHWPSGMKDFVVGVERWTARVYAYIYLMVDPYPPFALR